MTVLIFAALTLLFDAVFFELFVAAVQAWREGDYLSAALWAFVVLFLVAMLVVAFMGYRPGAELER